MSTHLKETNQLKAVIEGMKLTPLKVNVKHEGGLCPGWAVVLNVPTDFQEILRRSPREFSVGASPSEVTDDLAVFWVRP